MARRFVSLLEEKTMTATRDTYFSLTIDAVTPYPLRT